MPPVYLVVVIMNMNKDVLLVLCSCPSEEAATNLAHLLVNNQLAACINIVPGVRSLFSWKGKIEQEDELLLLIKSTGQAYPELEKTIKKNHPYEMPEIIALPIHDGASDYLNWVQENTCIN